MSRTLIAYFSRADENYFGGEMRYVKIGNTEIVVHIIEQLINADSYKIEMMKPYSANYKECVEEAKRHWKEKARPEMKEPLKSIDAYDAVIVAYPNYCGTIPMVVATFLEQYDWTGKTILPLCTHEGSGMGTSEGDIKKSAKGAAVGKGLSVNGSRVADAKPQVLTWLKEAGLY